MLSWSLVGSRSVSADRRARVAEAFHHADDPCEAARRVVDVTGASVMLMDGTGGQTAGFLCASNNVSRLIEDLQFSYGEGPCIDAFRFGVVVAEPDLARPAEPRWPAFTPPAVEAGVRGLFGYPLSVGTVRLGAVNLYRDHSGALDDDQRADAEAVSDVVAHWVLDVQAGAPPGSLATELDSQADFSSIVHQAAGMVSVQLDVPVAEALLRLRANAFATMPAVRRHQP